MFKSLYFIPGIGSKFCGLALLLALSLCAQAQYKPVTLTGYLALQGGELFDYKLVFTDSAGVLKGYTVISAQGGGMETRSNILGRLDKPSQRFFFIETGIVYNHGFQSNVQLCLVNAGLKYQPANKGHVLKGAFSSIDASNTYCSSGTITFINDYAFDSLFTTKERADTIATAKKKEDKPQAYPPYSRPVRKTVVTQQPVVSSTPISNQPEQITTGIEKTYDWNTDTLIITVWDGGHIDGDIITISYNNKPVLTNYTLTAARKEVRIPLAGKTDVLTILAVNEGNEPPNTANLLLTDGAQQYSIVAYNERGHTATIKIRKAGK